MITSDFHVHTTFSDGVNSPEENVLYAIENGFRKIGFSDHSHTFFDESYCMKKENVSAYKETVSALKEKYRGKIEIYLGIEQDYYSAEPTDGYDYIIGSLHYVKTDGIFLSVDHTEEILRHNVEKYFGGDVYAYCEEYYKTLSDVVNKTGCDIIGHFDLVSKFNEQNNLIDTNNARYIKSWQSAADKLLASGKPFEINTGAISRGCKTVPYPADDIFFYLFERGAKFILSSDSHKKEALGFKFSEYEYQSGVSEFDIM